ncbi:hypothetical protein AB0C47_33905 [Micromonospora taraxaci]
MKYKEQRNSLSNGGNVMDNIFNLDGSKKEGINIQNQMYELKSMLPLILEVAKMKSEYQHERLTSLRQQGFTEEQAIEIIKVERTPFDQ